MKLRVMALILGVAAAAGCVEVHPMAWQAPQCVVKPSRTLALEVQSRDSEQDGGRLGARRGLLEPGFPLWPTYADGGRMAEVVLPGGTASAPLSTLSDLDCLPATAIRLARSGSERCAAA